LIIRRRGRWKTERKKCEKRKGRQGYMDKNIEGDVKMDLKMKN
jgi:hypothetical protein